MPALRGRRRAVYHVYVIRQPDGRCNENALDYSHSEVRNRRLAVLYELIEAYDIDGIELAFTRHGKFFPRDRGREMASILTGFLEQVREALDRTARSRGRPLVLGVRVPETVDVCWMAGLDVSKWVERGWIDFLVVTTWSETAPQMPMEGTRRYHYLPHHKGMSAKKPPTMSYAWYDEGQSPLGTRKMQILSFPPNEIGERKSYRFRMADGRQGERLSGVLRFCVYHIDLQHAMAKEPTQWQTTHGPSST